MRRFSLFDIWFQPKRFESERLYERLGAVVIKRYVPTGGDLVMRRLRPHDPKRRWVTSNLQSLPQYERRRRLSESIDLIGFIGFTVLAASKFALSFARSARSDRCSSFESDLRPMAGCPSEVQPAASVPGYTLMFVTSPATMSTVRR